MPTIHPLSSADRDEWEPLWRGYLEYYRASDLPDEVTEHTFARLVEGREMHAALAHDEVGTAVGLVHWLTHSATWSATAYCYLEDLFVSPRVRGGGIGRALIEHVRSWAEEQGCTKVYWLTEQGNVTARTLYDKVAAKTGFIHYEIEL